MKKLSVTMKLTLWYACFMLLSIVLAWYVFERSANVAARQYYKDELMQAASLARNRRGFARSTVTTNDTIKQEEGYEKTHSSGGGIAVPKR